MKLHILLILSLVSQAVFCQTTATSRYRNYELGISVSPDYAYRALNYSRSNAFIADNRNTLQHPMLGFTAGISYRRTIKGKLSFQSGILYSLKGEQSETEELHWASPNSDFPLRSKTQFRYHFVEVPLKLRYLLNSTRIKLFVSGGMGVNIFTQKETKVITEFNGHTGDERSSVNAGYSKFNLAVLAGIGATYNLSQRIDVTLEPYLRRFVTSVSADKNAKEFPYSFGLNTAVHIKRLKRR